jgi:hypothetical protein
MSSFDEFVRFVAKILDPHVHYVGIRGRGILRITDALFDDLLDVKLNSSESF